MTNFLKIIATAAAFALAAVTGAQAATYSDTQSFGQLDDIDNVPPVPGQFNFGGPILGNIISVTMTSDPCNLGDPGCQNDTLGTGEFYVFDLGPGDIQTTSAAALPLGTPFTDDWTASIAAATLADLADGLLSFTVGCDDNALLNACTGVQQSTFTMTVETQVPLPATAPLLLFSLLGAGAYLRRRR